MAKDSDDTKLTIEDVDRVIREHERKDVTRQDIKKAIEERIAKSQEASELEFGQFRGVRGGCRGRRGSDMPPLVSALGCGVEPG